MEHSDQTAEAAALASAETPRRDMAGILEAAASRTALNALEQALALAASAADKRETAVQARSLAQSSRRAAEQMREHLSVAQTLPR